MAAGRARAGMPPIRRANGSIVVELPRRVRRLLVDAAEAVQRCVEDPSSPAFGQLYGRLDESADVDDPLFGLERQSAVDDVCAVVMETAQNKRLSEAQGEAWLRMLGMAVMVTAAGAGIRAEEDLDLLDPERSRLLDVLRALQLLVAASLDPALEDLDDLLGPEPD